MIIARRFSAGVAREEETRPRGTLETPLKQVRFKRPCGTRPVLM